MQINKSLSSDSLNRMKKDLPPTKKEKKKKGEGKKSKASQLRDKFSASKGIKLASGTKERFAPRAIAVAHSIRYYTGLFIQFIVIPALILLFATKLFVVKSFEREALYSSNAVITRESVKMGSEGYGTVNSIKVGIGEYVNKGDVLYTYYNSALDERIFGLQTKDVDVLIDEVEDGNISLNEFNQNVEFIVRAKRDGFVKDIYVAEGNFVTRENTAMLIEVTEAKVSADLKVSPHLVDRVQKGYPALVRLTPTLIVNGTVSNVYPTYNQQDNTIKVDITLDESELLNINLADMYSGAPVDAIVFIDDEFAKKIKEGLNNVQPSILREWLNYEVSF